MSDTSNILMIIIAVIAILGGLTLLIIGLIQNKIKLWIPGLIVFVIAFIIGIVGAIYSLRTFIINVSHNSENFLNNRYHDLNHKIFSDTTYNMDSPVDSTFAEPVSGFIDDADNSLIYIKVFPKKDLIAKGITLEKVKKGNISGNIHKAIMLIFSYQKEFKGDMKLSVFDYEKKELGSSTSKINQKQGETSSVNFSFPDSIKLSLTDYCILTEAK
jgi:hypothetical protein